LAIKQTKVSDLDGSDDAEYGVVVRDYPDLDAARILDVTKDQAEGLVALAVTDILTVEVRLPDNSVKQVLIRKVDLDKWLGKPEVLQEAAYLRGRRPGEGTIQFMKSITDDWTERRKQLARPATLTVQRGAYSQLQFKKPPPR
jgi:hypothetical protein